MNHELICYISSFLDVPDILNLGSINKSFTSVLNDPVIWGQLLKIYLNMNLIVPENIRAFNPKQAKLNHKAITIEVFQKYQEIKDSLSKIISKVESELDGDRIVNSIFKADLEHRASIERLISENFN
mmetsp:Transcript_11106/g.9500  ORF Transcript_11106/g.9500 Transcript_11106/m.9500 type:complete len:127 (+) Transcript_11106:141-521(+)